MGVVMKSKLNIQMLCAVKKVVAAMGNQPKVLVGTLIGNATDVSNRTSPDGTGLYEALIGDFEAIPADGGDVLRAGICYLPDYAHPLIADPLKAVGKDGKRVNSAVAFGFEVYLARDGAAIKWELNSRLPPAVNDPLASVREKFDAAVAASRSTPDAGADHGRRTAARK